MEAKLPERIVCMTEESVETLYLLGEEHRIVGVSAFVERPEAATKLKKVSGFTSANIEKIIELRPDLVLGFSDIQQDIAKELIARGLNVYISNQRSLTEILSYIKTLGYMVGAFSKTDELLTQLSNKIKETKEIAVKGPRVYIEEWDEPTISGIHWFSELVELCGGTDVFADKAKGSLAKERFVSNEEIISAKPELCLACWCGKKVDKSSLEKRTGLNTPVIELNPAIFLQPGPAPILDGIDILLSHFLPSAAHKR